MLQCWALSAEKGTWLTGEVATALQSECVYGFASLHASLYELVKSPPQTLRLAISIHGVKLSIQVIQSSETVASSEDEEGVHALP